LANVFFANHTVEAMLAKQQSGPFSSSSSRPLANQIAGFCKKQENIFQSEIPLIKK
jgi:hypothetical protein